MKRYSEKYINSYKILKNAVIGFEFECFFNTSFYKTLENLNHELSGVQVHGFRKYHSTFPVDSKNFKLERDLSGGLNMAELITGTLDYFSAKHYLVKILKFIQKYGYTTDKSSIHINLSFSDKDIKNLNIIKQIINTNEDEIYKIFPSRKNNIYAKSIKRIIPFRDYDYSNISVSNVVNTVRLPDDKYYGINFTHIVSPNDTKRIEFRYLGGEDYEYKVGDIIEIMDKFIITTYNNINSGLDDGDLLRLDHFLSEKINVFKSFHSYDSFLVEYPKIKISIDMNNTYEYVSSYFTHIQKRLYSLMESTDGLNECVINFYTREQKLEIINGKFSGVFVLDGYVFIDCDIKDAQLHNCETHRCNVYNSHMIKSYLERCDIFYSKIINSDAILCKLDDCYFDSGLMDSTMIGGVIRSGQNGPHADVSKETSVVNYDNDTFFGTTDDTEVSDKKKPLK